MLNQQVRISDNETSLTYIADEIRIVTKVMMGLATSQPTSRHF
jgi:hypothetical protein